jgi:hypothetical protein
LGGVLGLDNDIYCIPCNKASETWLNMSAFKQLYVCSDDIMGFNCNMLMEYCVYIMIYIIIIYHKVYIYHI